MLVKPCLARLRRDRFDVGSRRTRGDGAVVDGDNGAQIFLTSHTVNVGGVHEKFGQIEILNACATFGHARRRTVWSRGAAYLPQIAAWSSNGLLSNAP